MPLLNPARFGQGPRAPWRCPTGLKVHCYYCYYYYYFCFAAVTVASCPLQVYTETMLVQFATPDISVPHNAIRLTLLLRFPLLLKAASCPLQVYTETLLVQLATPDISMPYNVICLTSTVLAVFCGTLLNIMLKPEDRDDADQANTLEKDEGAARSKRVKRVLGTFVIIGFLGLGVYLDPDASRAVRGWLGMVEG